MRFKMTLLHFCRVRSTRTKRIMMGIIIQAKRRKRKEGFITDQVATRIITVKMKVRALITIRGRVEVAIEAGIGKVEAGIGKVEAATERIEAAIVRIEAATEAPIGMGIGAIEGDMIGMREDER
jgi:hypothetical protein